MADTIKTNLGPVTAYADAKAHGYTGTREEFGQLLAGAAGNLRDAVSAKEGAEAAKQAAETAQQAAAENQKNAGTHAENAKASADTAAEQADAAKESAAGAANSATAAQESETNAGLSADAAANAEAAAKQAQNAAETAKADAETAKTAAGSSAEAAANSAAEAKKTLESIPDDYSTLSGKVDENTSGIRELKEDLNDLLDVQHTRNLYNKNDKTYSYGIGSAGLDVQANVNDLAVLLDVEPNTTYTISGIRIGWNICYEFSIKKSDITIGSIATSKVFEGLLYVDSNRGYRTFTTSETAKSILLLYWRNGVDTVSEEEKRDILQIEKNSTYTSYIPFGVYSGKLKKTDSAIESVQKTAKDSADYRYVKNIPLFARHSNGVYAEQPTWWSRQYDLAAFCVHGKYLYTGSHLGFKKWDISIECDPVDVTKSLADNKCLAKNTYIEQWSINPWGTGGGDRIPYKMEFYNGYIFAIVRSGSGFVADDAQERTPNTNVIGKNEIEGTVGYFLVMDSDLNVLFKDAYYGVSKTEIGYRKPSGFVIDKETNRIYISCQLYGWMCYDIKNPINPTILYTYSPLDENVVSSINGADLSPTCGPIEYQNGCVFTQNSHKYYAVAGYVDGIHVWDVTDISKPTEVKNDIVSGDYGIFWQFRAKESAWNTTAHLFDVEVKDDLMYATIAPTTDHGNDQDRISGLLILNISDLSTPIYKFYPIDAADWNFYQRIGDVKPSHLLMTDDKVLLNNGNKGIAIYDNTGDEPVYVGCIPSDGDEIYQMVKTDDGRLISGCHIVPYNFRINRGIY